MKQQNKNILLIIGFLILAFMAYKFSILKTLEVRKQLSEIKHQINDKTSLAANYQGLVTRDIYLDSVIGSEKLKTSLQNELLEVLNNGSREFNFKIIAFNEPHKYIYDDQTETTLPFVLEGQYDGIETMLYSLENNYSFGTISHIKFERKKDFRLNKVFLECRVLMQNVR